MANNISIESLFGELDKKFLATGEEYKTDNSPIKIIAAANGVFEVRETPLGRFSKKMTTGSGLDTIKEGIDLKIPKIPFSIFNEMIAWFRFIYKQDRTESTAMVFFNEEKQEFFTWIPTQRNAGATSNYDRGNDPEYLAIEEQNTLVMVAHSHPWAGNSDPSPSGTDNNDEKEPLLYLIANNVEGTPNVYCSTCPGGVRQKLDFFEMFENPILTENIPEKLLPLALKATRTDIFDMYLNVDSIEIPAEWVAKHTKQGYTAGSYSSYYGGAYGGYYGSYNAGKKTTSKDNQVSLYDYMDEYNYGYDYAGLEAEAIERKKQVNAKSVATEEEIISNYLAYLEIEVTDFRGDELVNLIDLSISEFDLTEELVDVLEAAGCAEYNYDTLSENIANVNNIDVYTAIASGIENGKLNIVEADALLDKALVSSGQAYIHNVIPKVDAKDRVIDLVQGKKGKDISTTKVKTPSSGVKAGVKSREIGKSNKKNNKKSLDKGLSIEDLIGDQK